MSLCCLSRAMYIQWQIFTRATNRSKKHLSPKSMDHKTSHSSQATTQQIVTKSINFVNYQYAWFIWGTDLSRAHTNPISILNSHAHNSPISISYYLFDCEFLLPSLSSSSLVKDHHMGVSSIGRPRCAHPFYSQLTELLIWSRPRNIYSKTNRKGYKHGRRPIQGWG